jgi:hypothetical protein
MTRHCSLDSIDVHIPKLDVAGSIPVSRFLTSDNLAVPDLISLGCITNVFAQMVRPTKGF